MMKIVDVNGEPRECLSATLDSKFPGYVKISFASKVRKNYTHEEWYPIVDFVKNNPTLAHLADGKATKNLTDVGVASSATEISLSDKTKKWKENVFVGYPIWISRGLGEGQRRTITQNTDNQVVIDVPWQTLPNKTSQFVISRDIVDANIKETRGNVLPNENKEATMPSKKRKIVN